MKTRTLAVCALTLLILSACTSSTPAATAAPAEPARTKTAVATDVPVAATDVPAAATDVPVATEPPAATEAPAASDAPAKPVVAAAAKFNLNTATAAEIRSVPNTGNRMVREFFEYRPYVSIVQFRKEIGKYVDDAQVAEYEKSFYVPVSPNNADAETLKQLPGVDDAIADQLIAARPYADAAAFLAKLGELTSPEQAAVAAVFVE